MPSILNATTTTGLVSSGDNSGSLQLATNNGTAALTIDTSQNVGIGTVSPSFPLDVAGAIRGNSWLGRANISAPSADAFIYRPADNTLGLGTGSTERMRIDSSGNLLIGTSSAPGTGQLQVVRNANDGLTRFLVCNSNAGSSTTSYMLFGNDAYSGGFAGIRATSSTNTTAEFGGAGNGLNIFNNVSTLTLGTGGVTRMSITQAGVTGIQFAPTQVSSADANTLDDYEEGTWTPGISGRTFSAVYGMYRKIGSCVYVYGECNTINSAITDGTMTGLPFTTTNSGSAQYGGYAPILEPANWTLSAGYYYLYIRFYKNSTTGQFLQGSGITHNNGVTINTGGNFRFSGFYFVD